jgi:hypothetical protein
MFESSIWIDGHYIGKQDSLSTPHSYDLTKFITPGREQCLTIRIDNRDVQKISQYPSAYTDETQTIWNGIVGRTEIIIEEALSIRNVVSGVLIKSKEINLSFDLFNTSGYKESNDLKEPIELERPIDLTNIIEMEVKVKSNNRVVTSQVQLLNISNEANRVNITLPFTDAITLWDEFDPVLYTLEIEATSLKEGEKSSCIYQKQVGFRQIDQEEGILRVNEIQRFLRGNLDCCVYPYTGHPPMDLEAWKAVMAKTKAYGLNHIRFHSWCPPEAAFEAADQLGVYLQVEGPVWMDHWTGYTVGCHEEHHRYLPEEAMRIIDTYSIHPSFCIFSNGNELNGDFRLLEDIVEKLKDRNPNILYTLSTNWDRQVCRQDDVFIAQSVDGTGVRGQFYLDSLVTGTFLEYSEAVKKRKIPVLAHEVGQYVVYPNVDEIVKFTGVLKPTNYEVINKDLEEKNLLPYLSDFVRASGKLSWILYKAELEAALRTKGLAGIQLLGLQDFPGQSTATIGILDCFYDSKGIGTEEEFRAFCNDTVVLLKLDKFILKTSENFIADVEIAHYGKKTLQDVCIAVSIEDNAHNIIWAKEFEVGEVPIGLYSGHLHLDEKIFDKLKGKNSLIVKAGICKANWNACTDNANLNAGYSAYLWNNWNIWVYEEEQVEPKSKNCYDTLSEEAIHKLQQGENVLILAKPETINELGPSKFFPVFWSPVHFTSIDPCGMMIDQKHPLFETYFPTKTYADLEWKNILESGVSINLDNLTGFEPITMFVPNFYNNHKFSNLFEAKVLNGKVLVCSLYLNTKAEGSVEMKSLKNAILRYFASLDFNPNQCLELENLKMLFKTEEI